METIAEKISINESLLEELKRQKGIDQLRLNNIKRQKKEGTNLAILFGSIGTFTTILGLFTLSAVPSFTILKLIYSMIIASSTIGIVAEPLTEIIGCKKKIKKLTERVIATDNQINKISFINKNLEKNLINDIDKTDITLCSTDSVEQLKEIRDYLKVISIYGANREKFLKLHSEGRLNYYLKHKGFNDRDVYYINYYLNEDNVMTSESAPVYELKMH